MRASLKISDEVRRILVVALSRRQRGANTDEMRTPGNKSYVKVRVSVPE